LHLLNSNLHPSYFSALPHQALVFLWHFPRYFLITASYPYNPEASIHLGQRRPTGYQSKNRRVNNASFSRTIDQLHSIFLFADHTFLRHSHIPPTHCHPKTHPLVLLYHCLIYWTGVQIPLPYLKFPPIVPIGI
jgi:hypothetical protein